MRGLKRDRAQLTQEVMAFFAKQTGPARFAALRVEVKANWQLLREILGELIAGGELQHLGKTARSRFGRPEVMAGYSTARQRTPRPRRPRPMGPPAPRPVTVAARPPRPTMPRPVRPIVEASTDRRLPDAVQRVLSTGASADMRELLRHIRRTHPHVTEAVLQPVLDEMRASEEITRIPVGESFRYRRVAVRIPKAATA